jgi:hypothetical protein
MSLFLAIAVMAQEKPAATLDAGYRDMYNLQFEDAHKAFQEWERAHPEDPLGPASDAAAYLFSEFDRLHVLETELFTDDTKYESRSDLAPDANVKAAFQAQLAKAQQIADTVLARDANNANALFAEVLVLGLRGDYAALVEKRDVAGLSYMKNGRMMAERLLASNPTYYDAYLAVGIENYLLSLKWAPVRWILRLTGAQTDKETGLQQLRTTAEKGHYLKPYARLLLAVAALRDKNRGQARTILEGLAREFPSNRLYAKELAKLQ